jgi:hypothetical protein
MELWRKSAAGSVIFLSPEPEENQKNLQLAERSFDFTKTGYFLHMNR